MPLKNKMQHINISNPNKANCSGCTSCQTICPKHCISMQKDKEGFLYPLVNETECIDCGLCSKSCPWLTKKDSINKQPLVYAAKLKDNNIRKDSTSGGLFSAFANYLISKGGIIYGAAYNAQDKRVEHISAQSFEELSRIRGSKYVQSYLGDTFFKIKEALKKDQKVLFTGTPCQCAGLKSYLKKDFENLYIIDILCHSVPSPQILNEIINRTEKESKQHITEVRFRNKERGWRNSYHFQLFTGRTSITNTTYLTLFFKGLINRPSCYNCRFTNLNRPSDITIGDYWNIKKVDPSFEDNLGVSCVLINSKKGEYLFQKIKSTISCFPTNIPPAIQICMERSVSIPINRKRFWYEYENIGFDYVEYKYGHKTRTDILVSDVLAPIIRKLGISNIIRKLKTVINHSK